MHLYLVHCGFYDLDLCDGVYESHINLFVLAESFDDARAKAKLHPVLELKKMHVEGLQKIEAEFDPALNGETRLKSHRHRDLAS